MATAPIEFTGSMSGLAMKPKGGTNTDTVEFKLSTNDSAKWERFRSHKGQSFKVSMTPVQDNLPGIDKAARGVKRGSKAAGASHQAQD